jgi:hypothetical protein
MDEPKISFIEPVDKLCLMDLIRDSDLSMQEKWQTFKVFPSIFD